MQPHQRNQTMLRNFKLQMQPQAVPVSDFSFLTKPTSRKIVVSSDLDPNQSAGIDYGGVIAQGFCGPSNHEPHISRLRTQMRFFTPLSCDLEPDITKPNPRNIVISSDLDPDTSTSFGSGGVTYQGFRGPLLLNSSCHDFEKVDKGQKMSSQLWVRMAGYQNYITYAGRKLNNKLRMSGYQKYVSYRYVFISSFVSLKKYAVKI